MVQARYNTIKNIPPSLDVNLSSSIVPNQLFCFVLIFFFRTKDVDVSHVVDDSDFRRSGYL